MRARGLTTVESLLIAAAFIIVGVIGVLTFQGIGKSAAESLRANAIVTADRGGFDVTIEVLNGKTSGVYIRYGKSGSPGADLVTGRCIVANSGVFTVDSANIQPPLVAGQSATCRFGGELEPGAQYTYVVYAVDATSGKAVQIAKGVVTVGIS
ncbi:hypothetical protein [Pyrobaculum neutrophilum]|uniref:Flagellin n=1 Tax=Pyrobaculum neutrophilum (strain DSM 2338 / JCM 9278 / NBRC 100436 / V24Sta) TaxID=444157 RepID=B1Y8R6_PYRNV|nr:hypothetical protein [Pyrobaculum neutrophilum]ACB40145.1 conserved hypothetical protein [Pyrobaculum neutrophilum V24Sta]